MVFFVPLVPFVVKVVGFQIPQYLEQFPKRARRPVLFFFLERVAAQLTQHLQVGAGMFVGDFTDDGLIFHQPCAQLLQTMLSCICSR